MMGNPLTAAEVQASSASWLEVFSALGPFFVALLVGWIAWREWRVNKLRLKHELFERRFQVYKATDNYLSQVFRGGPNNEALLPFFDAVIQAPFLFDKDLVAWLKDLRNKAHLAAVDREHPSVETDEEAVQAMKYLLRAREGMVERFRKDMDLKRG